MNSLRRGFISVVALSFLSLANAQNLRFYPEFAEVREDVKITDRSFTVTFPETVWMQLLPGTIDLTGMNVLGRQQRYRTTWLATQEGKSVTLIEQDRRERVTLVRAEDLLIRDASGRYRNVNYHQLAFDDLPPLHAMQRSHEVTFQTAGTGNATLSYLTRALSWTPRYTLKASGSNATLDAFADVRNASDRSFTVNRGELLAGTVRLVEAPEPYAKGGAYDATMESMAAPEPSLRVAPQGESRGLHRYAITEPFPLPANSTVSVPFLKSTVTFERYAGLTTGFMGRSTEGNLNRFYRVRSNVLLPSGPVTVRDDGIVVGQATIRDTAANVPVELEMGADPDLRYARNVRVTRQDKNATTYQVSLTVTNDKSRALRTEWRELFDGNVAVEGQAERTAQGLLVRVDVPAAGKVTRTYSVTFRHTN